MRIRQLVDNSFNDMTFQFSFSPTEPKLVVGSFHGIAQLWDTQAASKTATLLKQRVWHELPIASAFSSNGKYLATSSGSESDEFRLWDTSTFKAISSWKGKNTEWLTWSPDNQQLAYGLEEVAVYDFQTGVERSFAASNDVILRIAWSQNGRYIVTGDYSGVAQVCDVESGKIIASTHISNSDIYGVCFLDNTNVLILSCYVGISKWSLTTNTLTWLHKYSDGEGGYPCCLSQDGKFAAHVCENAIHILDTSTGQQSYAVTPWIEIMDGFSSINFSPDATMLAFGDWVGGIWVCDLDEEN